MKDEVIATLVIILVIISAGTGYLVGITTKRTPSPYAQNITGLELRASVNATSLTVGQSLGINVSLYNSLPVTLTLCSLSPNYRCPYNFTVLGYPVAMWGDCLGVQPVEFMVVRGNYSLSELHTASANASITTSRCGMGGWVYSVAFHPESSEANLTGRFGNTPYLPPQLGSANLFANFTVNGFWAYPINGTEANDEVEPPLPPVAQHPFISGWYTLVVADEWGQTAMIPFSVT